MADKNLTKEQREAIHLAGTSLSTLGIPLSTILPFQNLLKTDQLSKIKQQEAMRMFPQADPNLFNYTRGGTLRNKNINETVPLAERTASSRVFDKEIGRKSTLQPNDIYRAQSFFPEYLTGIPGAPSPELGSFSQAIVWEDGGPYGTHVASGSAPMKVKARADIVRTILWTEDTWPRLEYFENNW